jgi:hypothetical protein
MILLQLALFAAGVLCFWLSTDLNADEILDERPHLRQWGRFYPR